MLQLLLVHLSLIFVFFTSSFGTHGISISDARQEKSVLPPLSGLKKQLLCQLPVLVHSPSVDEVSMACSSTSVFQQHRRLFKMMRSCIVSLNVAEIGSTVELSNTGNTVAKPSVFVTAPSWCLVLEVSPLGVPSKGFSYFFMDKKVKEKMSLLCSFAPDAKAWAGKGFPQDEADASSAQPMPGEAVCQLGCRPQRSLVNQGPVTLWIAI